MRRAKRSAKLRSRAEFRSSSKASKAAVDVAFIRADVPVGQFEANDDSSTATLTKRALLLVEGEHTDSKGRKHVFDPSRIRRIARNTSNFRQQGGRVPWQEDHDKTQKSNLGDLEDETLEVKRIAFEDLPDKRMTHLVGRLGIFAHNLVAKGERAVKDVLAGNIKTLSPGIDVVTDVIREISATPQPAIVGPATFSRHRATFSTLTWEDAEAEEADMDAMKEEYEGYCDTLWSILTSIQSASEDELQGADPAELQQTAIDGWIERVNSLLGMGEGSYQEEGYQDQQMMGPPQQQGAPPARPGQPMQRGRFSLQSKLAKFSLANHLRSPQAAKSISVKENR